MHRATFRAHAAKEKLDPLRSLNKLVQVMLILVKCCPDTGATQTVVCEQIACQAGLAIFPPGIGMVSLTEDGLNIIGESNVCLGYEGLRHETAVLIASDLSGDSMLVAWNDLQPLEVMAGKIFSPLKTHLKTHHCTPIGPHPRSLLRLEISRDSNPNLYSPYVTAVPSCSHPTPPTTPQAGRCVWLVKHSQPDNNIIFTLNRSPSTPSPVFSNDDEEGFQLDAILPPILSPLARNPGRGQALLPLTHGLDLHEGYKYVMHSNITYRCLAYRKGKGSCQVGLCASLSLHGYTYNSKQYKKNSNLIPLTSLQNSSTEITSYISSCVHSYYSKYVGSTTILIARDGLKCQLVNNKISMDNYNSISRLKYILTNYRYTAPLHPDAESQYTTATSSQCDLLQVAAISAGLADDDESTTYSIDSPPISTPSSSPSPSSTPISSPNRHLLVPPTTYNMQKNKNGGAAGDTPTKSPCQDGNLTLHLYLTRIIGQLIIPSAVLRGELKQ